MTYLENPHRAQSHKSRYGMTFKRMPVYVINLASRPDRWEQMELELQKIDAPKFYRVDAVHPNSADWCTPPNEFPGNPAMWGCFQSHRKVWERFKKESFLHKTDKCIVLEDDAQFQDRTTFWDVAKKMHDFPVDWSEVDMVYLGGNHTMHGAKKGKTVYGDIHKCERTLTTHAYVITLRGIDRFLECGDFNRDVVDVALANNQDRSYYIYPSLAIQRPSYSDIWGHNVDYRNCID